MERIYFEKIEENVIVALRKEYEVAFSEIKDGMFASSIYPKKGSVEWNHYQGSVDEYSIAWRFAIESLTDYKEEILVNAGAETKDELMFNCCMKAVNSFIKERLKIHLIEKS